jgi:hypothetical protein
MPTVDRFVDTETAAALCECSHAAIRSACNRGSLKNYGTYYQAVWDIQEVAKWAAERAKRKAKRRDKRVA